MVNRHFAIVPAAVLAPFYGVLLGVLLGYISRSIGADNPLCNLEV